MCVADGHEAQLPGEGLAPTRDSRLAAGPTCAVDRGRVRHEMHVRRKHIDDGDVLADDAGDGRGDVVEDARQVAGVRGLIVVAAPRGHGLKHLASQVGHARTVIVLDIVEVEPDGEDQGAVGLSRSRLVDGVVGARGGTAGPGDAGEAAVASVGHAVAQHHHDLSRFTSAVGVELGLAVEDAVPDVCETVGSHAIDGALHGVEVGGQPLVESGPSLIGDKSDLVPARVELVHQELGGVLGVGDGLRRAASGIVHGAGAVQHQHHVQGLALLNRGASAGNEQVHLAAVTGRLSRLVNVDARRIGVGRRSRTRRRRRRTALRRYDIRAGRAAGSHRTASAFRGGEGQSPSEGGGHHRQEDGQAQDPLCWKCIPCASHGTLTLSGARQAPPCCVNGGRAAVLPFDRGIRQ